MRKGTMMTHQAHKIALILSLLFLMMGCRDGTAPLVEGHRLPPILPKTIRDIKKIDIHRGEFYYDLGETAAFIMQLEPCNDSFVPFPHMSEYAAIQKKQGYDAFFEYDTKSSAWFLFVNAKTGHVRYVRAQL